MCFVVFTPSRQNIKSTHLQENAQTPPPKLLKSNAVVSLRVNTPRVCVGSLIVTKKMTMLELARGDMQREMELRTPPNKFKRNAGPGERLATLSTVKYDHSLTVTSTQPLVYLFIKSLSAHALSNNRTEQCFPRARQHDSSFEGYQNGAEHPVSLPFICYT